MLFHLDLNIFDWSSVTDLLYKKWYHVIGGVKLLSPDRHFLLNAQNKCSDQQKHSKMENHDNRQWNPPHGLGGGPILPFPVSTFFLGGRAGTLNPSRSF